VRNAAPEDAEEQVRVFAPRLLVYNDIEGLDPGVLMIVPCWIEVLYSNAMDARISVGERIEEIANVSTDILLRVADEAAAGTREP
jgi:hypothetical protein